MEWHGLPARDSLSNQYSLARADEDRHRNQTLGFKWQNQPQSFEVAADKIRLVEKNWAQVARRAGLHGRGGNTPAAAGRNGPRVSNTAAPCWSSMPPTIVSCWSLAGRTRCDTSSPHVTHAGVHDHGFNNISTYGNLRRLMREGRIAHNEWELAFLRNESIKASGVAVQATHDGRRTADGG